VSFSISAFRHFRVRHFGNPDDKELGHFALKTPKSRNTTCPWSRVVVTEEAAISGVHFGISGSGRSKDQEPSAARIVKSRILKSQKVDRGHG
jgi:hypothetical protein